MEELCPILHVPYKFPSSQHDKLAEINVCCLSCNKTRPHWPVMTTFKIWPRDWPYIIPTKFVKLSRRSSKSRFFIVCNFANGKLMQKWVWPTPNNSAQFREHIGMRFNNVQYIKWELWAKKAFALKIASPAVDFWCVGHRGHSKAPLWISFP